MVIAENDYGTFKFTVTVLVGKPEGAEIVTKKIESKSSVKVVEETIVDGKVVERSVKEETEDTKPEEKAMVTEKKTIKTDSEVTKDDTVIVVAAVEETKESQTEMKSKVTSEDEVSLKAKTKEVVEVKEPKKEPKKPVSSSSEESSSEESSSEESSSEESSSEEETDKPKGQPPKFSQPPEPVLVDVGETIKLTCKVTGWKIDVFFAEFISNIDGMA